MKDSIVVKNKDSLKLTPHDVALLEDLLSNGMAYINSETFADKEFCKKLLEYTGPMVDSSWFFNYMNSLDGIKVDSYADNVQLTPKQEKMLFLKYNYLKKRVDTLAKLNVPETYGDLIKYYYEAEEVKERIVGANLACVIKSSNDNTFKNIDFTEAISEGNIALNKSVDKFDVDQGNKFSTYLYTAIRSAFIKLDKANAKHSVNTVEYDQSVHDRTDSNGVDVGNKELFDMISDLVSGPQSPLTDEQRFVIEKKYNEGLTLDEIGQLMTPVKTKGQVFYVEKIAKDKLRMALDEFM